LNEAMIESGAKESRKSLPNARSATRSGQGASLQTSDSLAQLANVPDNDEIALLISRIESIEQDGDQEPFLQPSSDPAHEEELARYLRVLTNAQHTTNERLRQFLCMVQTEKGMDDFLGILSQATNSQLKHFLLILQQSSGYKVFVQQLESCKAWRRFVRILERANFTDASKVDNPCTTRRSQMRRTSAKFDELDLRSPGRSPMAGESSPRTLTSITAVNGSRPASGIHTPPSFALPRFLPGEQVDIRSPHRSPIGSRLSPRSNRAVVGSVIASGLATPPSSVTPPTRIPSSQKIADREASSNNGMSDVGDSLSSPCTFDALAGSSVQSEGRAVHISRPVSPVSSRVAVHGSRPTSGTHTPDTHFDFPRKQAFLSPDRKWHRPNPQNADTGRRFFDYDNESGQAHHGSRPASSCDTPFDIGFDLGSLTSENQLSNCAVQGSSASGGWETLSQTPALRGHVGALFSPVSQRSRASYKATQGSPTASGTCTPMATETIPIPAHDSPRANCGSRPASGTHTPFIIVPHDEQTPRSHIAACGSYPASGVCTPKSLNYLSPRGDRYESHRAMCGSRPASGLHTPNLTLLEDLSPRSCRAACGSHPASGVCTPKNCNHLSPREVTSNFATCGSKPASGTYTPLVIQGTHAAFENPANIEDLGLLELDAFSPSSQSYSSSRSCSSKVDEGSFRSASSLKEDHYSLGSHDAQCSVAVSGILSPKQSPRSFGASYTSTDALCASRPRSGLASLDGSANDGVYGSSKDVPIRRTSSVPAKNEIRSNPSPRAGKSGRKYGLYNSYKVKQRGNRMPMKRRSNSLPKLFELYQMALPNPGNTDSRTNLSATDSLRNRWYSYQNRDSTSSLQRRLAEDLNLPLY